MREEGSSCGEGRLAKEGEGGAIRNGTGEWGRMVGVTPVPQRYCSFSKKMLP